MEVLCKVEVTDITNTCRTCATAVDPNVLKDITPQTREMLLFCTGIELNFTSDLPMSICQECHCKVDMASQFKLQCLVAQEKLSNLIRNNGVVASTPYRDDEMDCCKTPKTPFFEIDIPLTPLRCDPVFKQLRQKDSPIGKNSSLTNLLSTVLDYTSNENQASPVKNSEKLNASDTINLDEVLSILDHPSNKGNCILDDSFNINISSPAKYNNEINNTSKNKIISSDIKVGDGIENTSTNELLDVDLFFLDVKKETTKQIDDSIDTEEKEILKNDSIDQIIFSSPKTLLKLDRNNKISGIKKELSDLIEESTKTENEIIGVEKINLDTLDRSLELDVNRNKKFIDIKKELYNLMNEPAAQEKENKSKNSDKVCKVVVSDFLKFSMPMKSFSEELKMLGHARCRFCYVKFLNLDELTEHMIKRHPIECAECDKSIDKVKDLNPEEKLIKKLSQRKSMRCEFCHIYLDSIENFYRHIRHNHEDEYKYKTAIYVCDYCNRKYSKRKTFTMHINHHQAIMKNNESGFKHKCLTCFKMFKNINQYRSHARLHEPKMSHVCDICGAVLSSKQNLKTHHERHIADKKVQCPICSKFYKTKVDMKHHMRSHLKSYECDICKKVLSRMEHLKRHYKVHTGETPYKCPHCDVTFGFKAAFDRHLRIGCTSKDHVKMNTE